MKKQYNPYTAYNQVFKFTAIFLIVILIVAFYKRSEYQEIYSEGVELLESDKREEAIEKFKEIPIFTEYKDVSELLGFRICPECGTVIELED